MTALVIEFLKNPVNFLGLFFRNWYTNDPV